MIAVEAKTCPDCQVSVDEPHEDGCDVARCLWTGGQRLSCDSPQPVWDLLQVLGGELSGTPRVRFLADRLAARAGTTVVPEVQAVVVEGLREVAESIDVAAATVAEYFGGELHDCGRDIWTGVWPGYADAAALGFFSYWGPDYGAEGWQRCDPDHPGAQPDLNRLHPPNAVWLRNGHRWVAP